MDSKIQYYKDFISFQVDLYLKFNANSHKIAKEFLLNSS